MQLDNFIGLFEGTFPLNLCQSYIRYYEEMTKQGLVYDRQQAKDGTPLEKDDSTLEVYGETVLLGAIKAAQAPQLNGEFNQLLSQCYQEYASKYAVLTQGEALNVFAMRLQKTKVGGGYHKWHCEIHDRNTASRVVAFQLYLNDVQEGGETEFLYLAKRFKPTCGTLLLWPAGFTHTHRGNPPLSGAKYILTGWIEY